MTENYVTAKIKEALTVSDGDKHAAQKLVITWAVRDATLLIGLTKTHLKGIVSAQIEHTLSAQKKASSDKAHFSKKDIDAIVASKPFGEKRSGPSVVPPPKSSARQASAIHQLVAAFKKKK